jgi:hypothetical protein
MEFSYKSKREWKSAAQRSVAMGTNGMVSSSQPLATLAGYKILLNIWGQVYFVGIVIIKAV